MSDPCLAWRDGWKLTAECQPGRNRLNVSVWSTHSTKSSGIELKVKEQTWDEEVRKGTGDLFDPQAED